MKTIRALRQEQGWTQFELALRVGVQPQAVYLWESGRRMPQVPQLRELGQLFGICSDEIILESGREPSAATAHQARAHRHRGEQTPGRDLEGRAVRRGRDTPPSGRDDR
ncbi:MAG TPA: helix-turn-helix transcriptional regulator [Herpetosiphonaceae bacterium]|nr:helix-turn-helix transcriptional regulator [Herpetosiphonaceae bacterium]